MRAIEPEDLEILYRWENDMSLWRYGSSLRPYSRFAIREYLSDSLQDILITRQLRLMLIERSSGVPVGTVDLYEYDPVNLRAGVGILLDEPFRGLGYGCEALMMLHDYVVRVLHLHSLFAYISSRNSVSIRLFASCGYSESGLLRCWNRTVSGFDDVYIYQIILNNHVVGTV
jgi:diamine N-acetyltransferase